MRVIIAGSREIDDYDLLCRVIESSGFNITEIVSGGCRGPDKLGERWAREHNIPIKRFLAQWKKYGKRAGPIRNIEMVEYVGNDGGAIFLWDGKSRGTKHCIESAEDNGLRIYINIQQ